MLKTHRCDAVLLIIRCCYFDEPALILTLLIPVLSHHLQEYDLSLCVSLLSLFDFRGDKRVTRQDWIRGTRALTLHAMGEDDELWKVLLAKFDTAKMGAVDLNRIEDLVPIDPRISLLMKAMFNSVTTLSDGMLRAQGKMETGEVSARHCKVCTHAYYSASVLPHAMSLLPDSCIRAGAA